jgi:hypothetical protein
MVYFTDIHGSKERLHRIIDPEYCDHVHTLLPMAWFIYTVPDLSPILLESSLRCGCPTEPGAILPNILLTLLLYVKELGPPI